VFFFTNELKEINAFARNVVGASALKYNEIHFVRANLYDVTRYLCLVCHSYLVNSVC
jgi:hypothetical protein